LKIVNAVERTVAAIGEDRGGDRHRRELRRAEVADDRGVDQHVQRLGGERTERR
jgi:hypothetical protein